MANRDERELSRVGRRARLELRFGVRNGRTALVASYAEPPFRVGRTLPEGGGREPHGVHMIMTSSAPGMFGGDAFEQVIHVESGSRVRLTSQSALQVHPSADGAAATLRSRYIVDAGAELSCCWDPVIPFAHSRLDQRIGIELANGARLFWSDAFMAGREARGERWQFATFAHELRVVREGRLDYLERFDIKMPCNGRWLGSDAGYFGSTIVSHSSVTAGAAEAVHQRVAGLSGTSAACDCLEPELLLVRLMSSSGPGFHAARQRVAAFVSDGLVAETKASRGQ